MQKKFHAEENRRKSRTRKVGTRPNLSGRRARRSYFGSAVYSAHTHGGRAKTLFVNGQKRATSDRGEEKKLHKMNSNRANQRPTLDGQWAKGSACLGPSKGKKQKLARNSFHGMFHMRRMEGIFYAFQSSRSFHSEDKDDEAPGESLFESTGVSSGRARGRRGPRGASENFCS